MADLFYCIVARFLYVAKRASPDLQVAVAFLCIRVKCPNIGDWKNLGRLVRYVRATIHLSNNYWVGRFWEHGMEYRCFICYPHGHEEPHWYCLTLGTGYPISGSSTMILFHFYFISPFPLTFVLSIPLKCTDNCTI